MRFKLILRFSIITIFGLLPLLLFVISLPIKPELITRQTRFLLVVYVYLVLLGSCIFPILLKGSVIERHRSSILYVSFITLPLFSLLMLFSSIKLALLLSLIFLMLSCFTLSAYFYFEKEVKARGVLSLIVTLNVIYAVEICLQSIAPQILVKELVKTPSLAPAVDRGIETLRSNGFRGQRPCTDCPDNLIRIVSMGGSSTFGVPMYYRKYAYPSILQRILDERRPGESYEVLNAGIAAFGIVQIIDALKKEVLKYKPDIVTICAWFNDSARSSIWYRMHGKSDREAYIILEFLRRLQKNRIYNKVHNTRLFALFRYYLLYAKNLLTNPKDSYKRKKRVRMRPNEFAWGVEEIIRLGKAHNFIPLFVTEAMNRTGNLEESMKTNKYYKKLVEVTQKHYLPLVDTLTPMSKRKSEWLFYDFIHPNENGHAIIAQAIYDTIFTTEVSNQLQQNKPNLNLVELRRNPLLQISKDMIHNNSYQVTARVPFLHEYGAVLNVRQHGRKVASFDGLSRQFRRFDIVLGDEALRYPIIDLSLRVQFKKEQLSDAFLIGRTGMRSPVHIKAVSGGKEYGWKSYIAIQGQRKDFGNRGYNLLILGSQSGETKLVRNFDIYANPKANQALHDTLEDLSEYYEEQDAPIVVIAVKMDGAINAKQELLSAAFTKIGATGALPKSFESFLLIGVAHAKSGTAYEEQGPRLIEHIIGEDSIKYADLIALRDGDA